MSEWPLLSLVIFLPLAGAGFIMLIRGEPAVVAQNARSVALWTASITFLLSLLIWGNFDPSRADFQLVEKVEWFGFGISYYVGVDGISLFFVLLSTLITLVCVVVSWESIQVRIKEYMVAFLVMETFMVGVFCALDVVLFYLFFEGILIPMFLIIGIWGGPRRVYSAFKFFLSPLAARPPRRGAARRFGGPGRDPPQARRLRLSPLLTADAAGRVGVLHAAD